MKTTRTIAGLALTLALLTVPAPGAGAPVSRQEPAAGAASSVRSHPTEEGLIVFAANPTGTYQLYTVRPDGSHLRQITHVAAGDAGAPDFSPDGRRIVFDVSVPSSQDPRSSRIAMIGADGSHLRWLPIRGTFPSQPSFTADGRSVVFERFDGVRDDALFVARLDGTHERRLTWPPAGQSDTEPNVSPDGKRLSFIRLGPQDTDAALFTLDLRTGRQRRLTPSSFDIAVKTSWSPNGRRIVFSRDAYHLRPGVSGNVMTISRSGHRLRAVTRYRGGGVTAYAGAYSPDGRHLVYRRDATSEYALVVSRPDGSHRRRILHSSTLRPRFIDWGPACPDE